MICQKCGTRLEDAKICPSCGEIVSESKTASKSKGELFSLVVLAIFCGCSLALNFMLFRPLSLSIQNVMTFLVFAVGGAYMLFFLFIFFKDLYNKKYHPRQKSIVTVSVLLIAALFLFLLFSGICSANPSFIA